jgi:hypothetical protein
VDHCPFQSQRRQCSSRMAASAAEGGCAPHVSRPGGSPHGKRRLTSQASLPSPGSWQSCCGRRGRRFQAACRSAERAGGMQGLMMHRHVAAAAAAAGAPWPPPRPCSAAAARARGRLLSQPPPPCKLGQLQRQAASSARAASFSGCPPVLWSAGWRWAG